MTVFRRNLQRAIVFTIILLVASGIAGLLYFLKMEHNEETFNRLQLQELMRVEQSIRQTIHRVKTTAEFLTRQESCTSSSKEKECETTINSRLNHIKNTNELQSLALEDFTFSNSNRVLPAASANVENCQSSETDPTTLVKLDLDKKARFTVIRQKNYEIKKDDKCSIESNQFTLELQLLTKHLLLSATNRFPHTFITDSKGNVIAHHQDLKNVMNMPSLVIEKISFPTDDTDYSTKGSKIVDTQINNTDVRFYITPLVNDVGSASDATFYVIGIIPNNVIISTKLQISSISFMWLIIGVLFFISLTPLIKLRFVNPRYSFTFNDKSQIVLGLVMSTAIATIALNQQLFYSYLNEFKEKQTERIFLNIQENFSNELRDASSKLDDVAKDLKAGRSTKATQVLENIRLQYSKEDAKPLIYEVVLCKMIKALSHTPGFVSSDLTDNNCSHYSNFLDYKKLTFGAPYRSFQSFFEMSGILNRKSELAGDYPVYYASENLFIELSEPLNLSKRKYVQKALDDEFWSWRDKQVNTKTPKQISSQDKTSSTSNYENEHGCAELVENNDLEQFYLQRIHNIEDARRVSMLVKPFCDDENPNAVAQIASLRFNSLVNINLPMGFSFAVLDKAGNAIFHHKDELSLVENFVYETNNNPELIAAISSLNAQQKLHTLQFDYKGMKHSAIIGSLTDKPSSVPWQLIVYYDESEIALNNMLLVFVAIILVIAVLLPIFIVMRFYSGQHLFFDLFYFNEKHTFDYFKWSCLFIAGYIAVVYSQGVLIELMSRLTVWLVLCLAILTLLKRRIKSVAQPVHWTKSPTFCILAFIIIYLIMGVTLSADIDMPPIKENWFFFVVGIALFLGSWAWTRFMQKRYQNKFNRDQNTRKRIDSNRFSSSYVMFITTLLLGVATMPAMMIAQSTNAYLLQRQADLQASHASITERNQNQLYNDYLSKLFDINEESKPSQAETVDLHRVLSTYLDPSFVRTYTGCEEDRSEPLSLVYKSKKWIDLRHVTTNGTNENDKCTDTKNSDNSDKDDDTRRSLTDTLIDHLFAFAEFQNSYGTQLSMFAKQQINLDTDDQPFHKVDRPMFRPDSFMIAASFSNAGFLILSLFVFYFITYWVIKHFIVVRLMGEHIYEHTQLGIIDNDTGEVEKEFATLAGIKNANGSKALVLLNTSRLTFSKACQSLRIPLYKDKCHSIADCLNQFEPLFVFQTEIAEAQSKSGKEKMYVALSGFEEISQDADKRQLAIELIRALRDTKGVVLLIVASASPFYRLINNDAYATLPDPDIQTNRDEISTWANIFDDFDKAYLWLPPHKQKLDAPLNLASVIKYEANGWPELQQIKNKLLHCLGNPEQQGKEATQLDNYTSFSGISQPEHVVEFFVTHASSFYRKQWELCTRDEKIALWQIANGASLNPANKNVIEHLTRRGYIYRHQGWHIINESFKKFVLSAEPEQHIEKWLQQNNEGLWKVLRIPIFVIFIVVVVVMYYSSGESLTSFITIATGTLGLIPLVLRNISLVKSHGMPDSE